LLVIYVWQVITTARSRVKVVKDSSSEPFRTAKCSSVDTVTRASLDSQTGRNVRRVGLPDVGKLE